MMMNSSKLEPLGSGPASCHNSEQKVWLVWTLARVVVVVAAAVVVVGLWSSSRLRLLQSSIRFLQKMKSSLENAVNKS